jgi:hypothetical protein
MSAVPRWIARIGWGATVAALLGLVFAAVGVSDLVQILEAGSWPSTPGRIVRSEIRSTQDAAGDTIYYLSLEYRYRYGGRDYRATRVSFGDTFDEGTRADSAHARGNAIVKLLSAGATPAYGDASRGVVEYRARDFPLGGEVTVHVDPAQPGRAVIDVQPSWYNTRYLFRAMVFFAIAAVLALARLWRGANARGKG